ncbi:hypothetical protein FACS1894151_07640 [Spirochaetia bacterium]|nr:hypothetical protein FACS1894151_07640 [Spirochaetia bacterium]
MAESIFRKESLDHVSSPEQLYDYIRVSNPPMWIVLAAILLLLVAGIFWAAVAVIPTDLPVTALAVQGNRYVCYLPPELGAGVKKGMAVQAGDRKGRVLEAGEIPESFREVSRSLPSDYSAYALGLKDWNLKMVLEFDSPVAETSGEASRSNGGTFLQVRITTARTRPLDFIFNPNR